MKNLIVLFFFSFYWIFGAVAQDQLKYSFFVGGHAYGNPSDPEEASMHLPFVNYFDEINEYPGMSFGLLTGDFVRSPLPEYFDTIDAQLTQLNFPVYKVCGNHDLSAEFESRYGAFYYHFIYDNELFIVLTPGLDSWNISDDQLLFLDTTLAFYQNQVDRAFVFMHELVWWSPTNQYANVKINYEPYYPGSTNFESVVKPMLEQFIKPVTVYAGDVGCNDVVTPFMYDAFNNVTLIASGMGSYLWDNIVVTEVYENSVYYNLVAINGDFPEALGELTDYSLMDGQHFPTNANIYPNPSGNFIIVSHNEDSDVLFELVDYYGNEVSSFMVVPGYKTKIDLLTIAPGVYFMKEHFSEEMKIEQIVIVK